MSKANLLSQLFLIAALFCALAASSGCTSRRTAYYQCTKCGQVEARKWGKITALVNSPAGTNCAHAWKQGVSMAVREPIASGAVVVVRQHQDYGAFVIDRQGLLPEVVTYRFYFQTNVLDRTNWFSHRAAGTNSGSRISFGPFSIPWSGRDNHSGYIYFAMNARDPGATNLEICVTRETDLQSLNVPEGEWSFKKWLAR